LPLQKEAIQCVAGGRDSIVVLPTGGGKSLCFQAPAVTMPGLALVVSPLISLMKDQVDALIECGVPAARMDSSQSAREQSEIRGRILNDGLKLLYVSPERMVMDSFINLLRKKTLSLIAVDEAHCVSMWGHDFRPQYRQLGLLKEAFPGVAVHAYTATATQRVRSDIGEQLRLQNPSVLVGSFDRPNLVYKVQRRDHQLKQVCDVLNRHKNESGIIYCIRRADVDKLCAALQSRGYKTAPYHAGMTDEDRKRNQELFIQERVDIIVATIAFGMGIDKSNVRYVLHTGMPKSIEHYQQESGRAGRDGLEAECCLLFSGADYGIWKSILNDLDPEFRDISYKKLSAMYRYCTGVTCRHEAIVSYFGQTLSRADCAACDVCLDRLDTVKDPLVTAQKILSCVVRLDQRFGADYTSKVLTGSREQRILDNGHDSLSTFGILSDFPIKVAREWTEQLVAQNYLEKTGEYNVLSVTEKGWRVLKGNETPRLLKQAEKAVKKSIAEQVSWREVDKGLFDQLRKLRIEIAISKKVPAYIVFSDATLRDIARRMPLTLDDFLLVKGVGERKCSEYGRAFVAAVKKFCKENQSRERG